VARILVSGNTVLDRRGFISQNISEAEEVDRAVASQLDGALWDYRRPPRKT
jgi:hypothetical protein